MTTPTNRRTRGARLASIAGTLVCASGLTARPQGYTKTEVLPLAGHNDMHGLAINDVGQVVGRSFMAGQGGTAFRAVLYTPGAGLSDISPAGAVRSAATLINTAGQAIVIAYEGEPQQRICRYTPGVGTVDLGAPAQVAATGWVAGLNESGAFVGSFMMPDGSQRPFLYSDAGGWKTGGQIHPTLETHAQARAINDLGQITGVASFGFPLSFGYLYTPDQGLVNIGHLWAGFEFTFGADVSATGVVAAYSAVPSTQVLTHAARYVAGSGLEDIHSLAEPPMSEATFINDQGDITGYLMDPPVVVGVFFYRPGAGMSLIAQGESFPIALSTSGHVVGSTNGFAEQWVWSPAAGMTSITDLLNPGHNPDVVVTAQAINNTDRILAFAADLSVSQVRTYVLTPEASCYPDCNGDGALTIGDFGCFQTKFVSGDPYADCNGAGGLTIADFSCFQGKFVAGCP